MYILSRQTIGNSIIRPIFQYNVNKSHANEQWRYSYHHDAIFNEDFLCPDIASTNTNSYDSNRIASTPPTNEQRRFVVSWSRDIWSLSHEVKDVHHELDMKLE